jgi:galactokinase
MVMMVNLKYGGVVQLERGRVGGGCGVREGGGRQGGCTIQTKKTKVKKCKTKINKTNQIKIKLI